MGGIVGVLMSGPFSDVVFVLVYMDVMTPREVPHHLVTYLVSTETQANVRLFRTLVFVVK